MNGPVFIVLPPDPKRRTWGRRPASIARRVAIALLSIAAGVVIAYAVGAARAHVMNECTAPAPGYALHWTTRATPDGGVVIRCHYEPELDA